MYTKREKHFLYNSLSILLKAVEKQRTTIDLRNEASIFGIVEQADAIHAIVGVNKASQVKLTYMNVVMRDCVFTDPRGDSFKFDMFFVQARNIRCVHIPPNIRIIPSIKEQLKQLSGPSKEIKNTKYTFKEKRIQQRQQESLAAVDQILESRNETKSQSTK